mmetsp:Transcript_14989/g.28393  ORF Transcript_14989/g.28393 Transcript_14989/m.28393 type:complete len:825 (-) Transcript_14989:34-2508(-)
MVDTTTTTSVTTRSSSNNNNEDKKIQEIEEILLNPDGIDLWRLREACLTEGGLVHDSIRRRVWPLLVGLASSVPPYQPLGTNTRTLGGWNNNIRTLGVIDDDDDEDAKSSAEQYAAAQEPLHVAGHDSSFSTNMSLFSAEDNLSVADSHTTISHTNTRTRPMRYRRCQDHYQIDLDVARCTWHLLTGDQRAQRVQMEHKRNRQIARIIRRKQRRLGTFINLTLLQAEQEQLRYYQGYHDVACIFLTTLASGPALSPQNSLMAAPPALELPARVLYQVSQSHLRDYLKDNFVDLQTALRLTVFPMLAVLDPAVHDQLYAAEMQPFFCLSWVITWFAHEIRDSALVKRLFDAFLVGHPLLPLYVSIAMILHPINRRIVLDTEPDFAILHQTLRGLPRNSSMVGWKYRPGDGYVSDDEDDDDDDDDEEDAAVEARLDAAVDGDIHQLRSVLDKDGAPNAPTGATSSVSTGSTTAANASEFNARVPFQELMDMALGYMQAIPPRDLLSIAKRYYGKAHVKELLEETNTIELMGDVPLWSIQPTLATATPPKVVKRILRSKKESKAVLALGFGLSDLDRRRRKRIFWFGVVAVAVLAVAVAWLDASPFQRMQNMVGRSSGDSSSNASCPSGPDTPSVENSAPGEGRSVKNSIEYGEATVSVEGNVEPVMVSPQAFVSIRDLPPAQARKPDIHPVSSGAPPRTSPSTSENAESMLSSPLVQWLRNVSAQERLQKPMEDISTKLYGQLEQMVLLIKKSSSRPMIADGKKSPRVARKLKPLRNFLSKPIEEIWQDGQKIAHDQGELIMRWLHRPFYYGTSDPSRGKGKVRYY